MACPEVWRAMLFCLCGLGGVEGTAHAGPDSSSSDAPRTPLLARVEIALLGAAEQDPVLFERIRSLFPASTAVVQRDVNRIDRRAVLLPERADTVYIWIRVTEETNARVYLALNEEDGRARYLFREIKLDAALDEVGGETLAEVAHSSAQALWLRELQTPRQTLVAALEREDTPPKRARPVDAPPPQRVASEARDFLDPPDRRFEPSGSSIRLALGASESAHAASSEGWMHEPGALLALEYRAQLSLRAFVRYLVPTEFELPPARVRLSGVSGEARAGWLSGDFARMRVRLEAGLGVLWGNARASIVADEPKASALAAQKFERVYASAAALVEWRLGPAWLAGGADLRVPLQSTSYEVQGQDATRQSSTLSPGASLELGFGFDLVR
jgi:hypothetical protein